MGHAEYTFVHVLLKIQHVHGSRLKFKGKVFCYINKAGRILRPVYVHSAYGNSKTRTTAALSIG